MTFSWKRIRNRTQEINFMLMLNKGKLSAAEKILLIIEKNGKNENLRKMFEQKFGH
jgi:hypothetical protein